MARQVFAMRTAISPRFAISSVRIGKQSLYCWLTADLLQDHIECSFGTGTDSQIVRHIHPANDARGIDEEFGRPGDVLAVLAGFGMQDAVAANHPSLRIGEKRIGVSARMAELGGLLGRIDADGHHFDAVLMKLAQMLLEAPQLGVAKWSPISAIEDQDYAAVAFYQIGEGGLFSVNVREGKLRRWPANLWSSGSRRQLLGEKENSYDKESCDQQAQHAENRAADLAVVSIRFAIGALQPDS